MCFLNGDLCFHSKANLQLGSILEDSITMELPGATMSSSSIEGAITAIEFSLLFFSNGYWVLVTKLLILPNGHKKGISFWYKQIACDIHKNISYQIKKTSFKKNLIIL